MENLEFALQLNENEDEIKFAIEVENLLIERKSGEETFRLQIDKILVPQSKFCTILGDSGCGKSTLLTFLGLLRSPTKIGKNLWFNQPIYKYVNEKNKVEFSESERDEFRKNLIGFALQGGDLIPTLTVEENLFLALSIKQNFMGKKETQEWIDEILQGLEINDQRARLPKNLSGGQTQRGVIARAIVTKPQIILMDEPTSNLDEKTARKTLKLLRNLLRNQKTCLLMITHNVQLAKEFSDKIIKMHAPDVNLGAIESSHDYSYYEHLFQF